MEIRFVDTVLLHVVPSQAGIQDKNEKGLLVNRFREHDYHEGEILLPFIYAANFFVSTSSASFQQPYRILIPDECH